MSSELDRVDDPNADKDGLIRPKAIPYEPPEVAPSSIAGTDAAGLTKLSSEPFDIDNHLAHLEVQVGKWVPILLLVLMVLTFTSIIIGPSDVREASVQVLPIFTTVISGALGYVFGRQSGR